MLLTNNWDLLLSTTPSQPYDGRLVRARNAARNRPTPWEMVCELRTVATNIDREIAHRIKC